MVLDVQLGVGLDVTSHRTLIELAKTVEAALSRRYAYATPIHARCRNVGGKVNVRLAVRSTELVQDGAWPIAIQASEYPVGRANCGECLVRDEVGRYLALVRAVLKRAAGPWQWIEKAPTVSLYAEAKRRVRWLNKEEATRLLDALPTHQKQLTRFALATGLRQANVLGLKWSDVDMDRRTAWVHADEAKGGEAIGVPLNDEAMAVLREEFGKHLLRVFTFKGRPLGQANTRAWRNALKRAGIENFRWHDLRHVWATWHVMAGTTMAELQELGAWKSAEMVRRYAHFAPEQLRAAADKLGTFSYTPPKSEPPESSQAIE